MMCSKGKVWDCSCVELCPPSGQWATLEAPTFKSCSFALALLEQQQAWPVAPRNMNQRVAEMATMSCLSCACDRLLLDFF